MPYLEWRNLSKSFSARPAVERLSLSMAEGEILALLGPSGSGKTTLLRMTAGLETPETGQVFLRGQDLSGLPPNRRGMGLMFQDYCLFPHLNVEANIAFGLRMKRWPASRRRERIREMLRLVRMEGFEKRSVLDLSGGEQQRVALARSLAPSPSLLMLDEPLGALDAALRGELLGEIPEILKKAGATVLYVTHDQEEALSVSDRVALIRAGTLAQVGSPQELIDRPASAFVASFLKLGALVPAVLRGGTLETDIGSFPFMGKPPAGSAQGHVLIRPTALRVPPRLEHGQTIRVRIVGHTPRPAGISLRITLMGREAGGYELSVAWNEGDRGGDLPPRGSEIEAEIDLRSASLLAD